MWLTIGIIAAIIVLYITTFAMNKSTPIPEDCLELIDEVSCDACNNYSCTIKQDFSSIKEDMKNQLKKEPSKEGN
ncbi:MAG: hypothetical protein ACQEQA_04930 [Bacillota bacterium]